MTNARKPRLWLALSCSAAALVVAACAGTEATPPPAALQAVADAPVATAPQRAPVVEKSVKAGSGLYEIVFNPADGDIYIAAVGPRGENKASVVRLDGRTLEAKAPIDVASTPVYGLGFNKTTQVLYGTDTRQGLLVAIDVKTGKTIGTVQEGDKAHIREVIVDEVANKAYATVVGGPAEDNDVNPNQVWVIDGATQKLDRIITVNTSQLTGIALDTANKRLYATGMGGNEIAVVDLTTDKTVANWPAGGERPTNIAFDSAGARLFIANQGTGDMTVLDANTGALLKTVKTGAGALSVAFNPTHGQVYVANRQAGTTTVISTKDYSVIADLKTGTFPQTIAINAPANVVYVTNKARGLPRDAAPGTPVPDDPTGDTVTLIRL